MLHISRLIISTKNASVTWVGINDVDEYWQLISEPYTINHALEGLDPNTDTGIIAHSMYFGAHPYEKETIDMHLRPSGLLMDCVWRAPEFKGSRKLIVSPKVVEYMYVHWVTKRINDSINIEFDRKDRLRINHHRRPFDNVKFHESKEDVKLLVNDESLRNMFRDRVLEAIVDVENEIRAMSIDDDKYDNDDENSVFIDSNIDDEQKNIGGQLENESYSSYNVEKEVKEQSENPLLSTMNNTSVDWVDDDTGEDEEFIDGVNAFIEEEIRSVTAD